ncbi:MAG: efflux RND transporter periplasmic adaptor subunit [Cyanobacteriota bacterium]
MHAPSPLRPATTPPPASPPPKVVPAPPTPLVRSRRPLPGGPLGIGLALGLAVLAGTGVWFQQRRMAQRDVTPFTAVARSGSLPGIVTATGELDAVKRVNVSPRRQGLLAKLFVDEGDTVRAGQPLALMDAGDLMDRQQELVANLRSAEAELARSASELARNEPLYRQGAISLNELNRYRTDYEVKRMGVAAARQRVEQRGVEGDELIVRAPFDGVISQRYADPGSFVTPTTTASATAGATSSSIVELAQGLEVLAKVPESDLGRLRVGLPASVRFDAFPDRRFAARIRQIAPRAVKTNNVTSFEVKLALLDPSRELRIGMNADVDFQTGKLQADTLVPTVAVVTEKGRPGVLLVGKDRQPTFQPVELGVSSGRDTQILSGVKAGTQVFIDLPPWAKKRERS